MRERILLAGLLDKLADLLKTSDELQTDDIERNRREIESCIDQINLCLAKAFQTKTPIGEQRAISGVVE